MYMNDGNKTKINLRNKSVFITGVAGFIGSNLAKRLLSTVEGVKVVGLDNMNHYYDVRLKEARLNELEQFDNFSFVKGNLADKAVIESIFEQYKPEIVVNLGAQAGVRYSITNPDAYVEANLIGFYNILEACRHSYDEGHTPVEHLVYASSSSVYGSNKKVPYSTDDKVDNPVSLYAATKKSNELMAHVRNPQSIRDAMPGVDYIFHAAALKQVPSCEFFPMQAVQTNIIGTDNVLHAAIDAGVKRVVCLSTDKAAYPINAMGISKAMMEHVIYANARVAAERGGTTICCTRYGNVMCSRGSVIPLFIDQIKAGNPITITDPNMTRFLMNLDEAVDLVLFAFQHANPGDLFIQKSDASTIGDLAKAVQQLFGDTGTNIIGTRHGEKLFETLMTREERLRSQDMGHYFRVAADNRDLNYDKFVVNGEVHTMADESYTSHNTTRLDVEGTVKKILTTEYVQNELKGIPNV